MKTLLTGANRNLKSTLFIILCYLCVLLFNSESAQAQQKVTAAITITNATFNGFTLTVNGATRTFTNNVVNTATQVATNSDVTGDGSKTNLLTQIYANPFSQVTEADTGSNSFNLIGNANLAMAVSVNTNFASISYSTQTVASVIAALLPVSALPTAVARTNVASGIAGALNAAENTNAISQISTAASGLMGLTNGQTISGVKVFTNALGQWFGVISNSPAISGTIIALSGGLLSGCTITQAPSISGNIGVVKGGYWTNGAMDNPKLTNGVNYGSAFHSAGSANGSEQIGQLANASGENSSAFGSSSVASGESSIAIGSQSTAVSDSDMAFGISAIANGGGAIAMGAGSIATNSAIAIGVGAIANKANSTAMGVAASATFLQSTAIGYNSSTTAANQVMLGAPGVSTVVQNDLTVQGNSTINGGATILGAQTNGAFSGTNNFLANSDVAFTRHAITTIANGNNSAVPIGTNVFFELSGMSGAFATCGLANGRDGKIAIGLNQSGFQWTIPNESGSDPTPANRIRTMGSAADLVLTNAVVTFIYSGAVSRWLVVSHNP